MPLEEAAQSRASRLSTIWRVVVLLMAASWPGFVSFITAAVELSATLLLVFSESQPMSLASTSTQSIAGRGPGAALGVLAVLVVGLGTYFSHRFVERSRVTTSASTKA